MKTKMTKKISLRKFIILIIILSPLIAISAYMYFNKTGIFSNLKHSDINAPVSNVDYTKPSSDQVANGQETKDKNAHNSSPVKNSPQAQTKPATTQPSSLQNNIKNTAGLEISNYSTGNPLKISTLIQEPGVNGSCTLILSRTGYTSVQKIVGVQISGNIATCKGFSISGLAKGVWNIKLSYKSNSTVGEVTMAVKI